MPAISIWERDLVARVTTTESSIRMPSDPTAPARSRQHVRDSSPEALSEIRLCDLVLLTSEVVGNAVEYSSADVVDLGIVRGERFTRIEVSSPDERWASAPEAKPPKGEQIGGFGLFLVDRLSDQWGTDDADSTVWFEFDDAQSGLSDVWAVLQQVDYPATRETLVAAGRGADDPTAAVARLKTLRDERYENAEAVRSELVDRRAESNPGLVAINADVCEHCGFARAPGEPHSCVEEKARFSESVEGVTETFEKFDESVARQAKSDDLRDGDDRRQVTMEVPPAEERRRPNQGRGRRQE